jgi:hypothetical protein
VGRRWRWSAGYLSRWHDLAKDSVANLFRPSAAINESGVKPAGAKKFGLNELVPSWADLDAADALWNSNDPMPAIGEVLRTLKDLAASDVNGVVRKLSPVRSRTRI